MQNTLFINPLGEKIVILVISGEDILLREEVEKSMNTSSIFPKVLVEIVEKNVIQNIYCISGPGPFTLMRIVTLSINALNYTHTIILKSCHFFELIENTYIALLEANAQEFIIGDANNYTFVKKEYLPNGNYKGIFSHIPSTENQKCIHYKENISDILRIFEQKTAEKRIYPIYIKPPHITGPKI